MKFQFDRFTRSLVVSAAIFFCCAAARGDDLEIDYTIARGHIVVIQAHHEDKTPAKGVKVSLVDAEKKVIADGKINADGEWSWPAPGPGSYELVLDPGSGEKAVRIPVTVKPAALPSPEPDPDRQRCDHCPTAPASTSEPAPDRDIMQHIWLPIGAGTLGIMAVGGLVFWFGRRGSGVA
jgi:hypothetical protein